METVNTNTGSIPVEQMLALAFPVVLGYDYFLTLGCEIERFWKRESCRRLTWGSFLFFANRYLALLGFVPIGVELLNQRDIGPTSLRIYSLSLLIILQIVIGCMLLMRVCALYEHRAGLLVFTAIVVTCTIAIVVVLVTRRPGNGAPKIPLGCGFILTAGQAHYLAAAWAGEFVFDVVIFAMTLYKTITLPRGNGIGLLSIIMRDGAVYFGVMTALNLANILVLIFVRSLECASMINPTSVVSSIMMNRLTLNLRDPQLNGGAEEFKITTVNIRGFSRQRTSGGIGEYPRGSQRDESSV